MAELGPNWRDNWWAHGRPVTDITEADLDGIGGGYDPGHRDDPVAAHDWLADHPRGCRDPWNPNCRGECQ